MFTLRKDGYPDLIISAPFYEESASTRGKVYLFNGFSGGIRSDPSQIISRQGSRAFGSSLTSQLGSGQLGTLIAIGDFKSNIVNLYSFLPSMRIEAQFRQMNITTLGQPALDGQPYRTQNDLDCSPGANCWRLCLKFMGEDIPQVQNFNITSQERL